MKKQKSFWPLPGGTRNYHKTLVNMLNKVSVLNVYNDFVKWFKTEYNLEGKRTPTNYINLVRQLDLIKISDGKISLTSPGLELLRKQDDGIIFRLLLNKIEAFEDILNLIRSKEPITKEEIQENIEEILHVGWKTDAQINWRLNWLLGLGIIEITSGKYYLTDVGIEQLKLMQDEAIESQEKPEKEKKEDLVEITHSDLEDKLRYIGEFFEFESVKRPKINMMLPEDRQLKSSNKELDGLWIKKIPLGGKIYYPIEVQIGGNLSDIIDRLETVSDFAQKALIVIDKDQEKILRERLNAKRSKLLDKIVCIRYEDVFKIVSATNALKSFFSELFK